MKRKILVLDPHTNGHEAALKFIRRHGWDRKECEIIFCGSHEALLKKLSENEAYGVLPVYNSTKKGPIASVTSEIANYRDQGFNFTTLDTLHLRINHYLMAQPHINTPQELERVLSKEEALGQCDVYLHSLGITPDKRSVRNSTGGAALQVSAISQPTYIGAIATKSAARAYGLKILAEKIQDNPKNTTIFKLIENKMVVERLTVGIIGRHGRYGTLLARFFESLGCTVIGSDRKVPTELTNIDVAKQANVIIFAIPIKRTVETVHEVAPYVRADQLLMDVTSVKVPVIKAMLKTKAQVVGLHPMFAPELGFEGQTVVVFPARFESPYWKTWVVNVLARTGSKLKWSTAKVHDTYMATIQVSPQSSNLVDAVLTCDMGVSVSESLDFTSPFYLAMFSLKGRLLSQSPELYGQIFMQNPSTVPMLRKRIRIERKLIEILLKQDTVAFAKLFADAGAHFGPEVLKNANELFLRINSVLKGMSNKSSVLLEFETRDNRPRLLEKILRVFGQKGINLTSINSVDFSDRRHQFAISFAESRSSERVQSALAKISSWKDTRVAVLP